MIVWANDLRCSEKKEKAVRRMKRRIMTGRILRKLYCVTIPQNPQNVMDVIPARDLKRRPYRAMTVKVIGMAKGEAESRELVRSMVEELYQKTGGFDAGQYYK